MRQQEVVTKGYLPLLIRKPFCVVSSGTADKIHLFSLHNVQPFPLLSYSNIDSTQHIRLQPHSIIALQTNVVDFIRFSVCFTNVTCFQTYNLLVILFSPHSCYTSFNSLYYLNFHVSV